MLLTKALIETNFGNIEFSLLPDLAPETVRNFTKLAESEFTMDLCFIELFLGL